MKTSPNRFTKTSQGRSWNTGNGSPDAICLTVDKPGVVLVGVCVYGGGGIHEYELEVLADDVSNYNLLLDFSSFLQYIYTIAVLPSSLCRRSTQGTLHIHTDGHLWN